LVESFGTEITITVTAVVIIGAPSSAKVSSTVATTPSTVEGDLAARSAASIVVLVVII
jgi:hypothetical protein